MALPTADDFFGPAPAPGAAPRLPTADEFFGPAPTESDRLYAEGDASAALDHYFHHTVVGRLLDAVGQGAEQGWGADPLGPSPETEAFLRKSGIWNDYEKGQHSIIRAFNEAVMRPAGVALEAALRGSTAVFRGAQALIAQTGEEAGAPQLGRELAALPEAFPETPRAFIGMPPTPGAIAAAAERGYRIGGAAERFMPEAFRQVLPDIAQARGLGVVGEGEAGWKGTEEPEPRAAEARAAAIKDQVEAAKEAPPEAREAMGQGPPVEAPPTKPDLHAAARAIAPEVFTEYDALAERKDALRRRLDDLRGGEDIRALEDRIDELRGRRLEAPSGAQRRMMADQITALEDRRETMIDERRGGGDTAEMADLRRQMMAADFRMRDLAPQVSAAYRDAEEMPPAAAIVPREIPPPAPEAAPVAAPPEAVPAPTPVPAVEAPRIKSGAAAPAVQPVPVPLPVTNIISDVSRKLVAAGRPQVEADAAAALIGEYYRARAARFGGVRGTPEELYAAEAPDIAGAVRGRKGAAGKTVINDARSTITLFRNADASTFLHETGHDWLNRLVRDAADPQAPAGLKADAATVRQWLGAAEGAEITTRQHEKFARGFERYMMEGRAPSQALAGVFAQFKGWLTQIYQTVARLRAPITDDIRDVFARLLTAPERRTVITPDETPSLAERGALEVEATAPRHAAAVADMVRQEAEDSASRAPEVLAELPGGRVAVPEAVLTGIVPSGGEIQPGEGARPGGEPAEPASGGDRFGARADAGFDKAGNIRLDNLNTPEDVNQVLRLAAARANDFMDERRGVISDAQVLDLADALDMDPKDLDARRIGQAFNAEEIVAARKLLIQSATQVRDLAAIAASSEADADLLAYAAARDRHLMIQGQLAGITAEAGRALRAFRALEGAKEAAALARMLGEETTGRTMFQLRREAKAAAALATPQQVSKFTRDQVKPGFGDMIQEYWINGLISGPATHTTYAVGNALLALWKAGPETGMAAAVGAVRRALGAEGDRVLVGEVPAQLYGLMKGVRDGVMAAGQAARTGLTVPLPGEELTGFAVAARPRAIPDFTLRGVPIPLGTVVRWPSRLIAMIHSFFRMVNYEREMAGLAYRQAAEEGLSGNALAARIGEITTNPDAGLMEQARGSATELTLMGKGGQLTAAISHLTNVRFAGVRWLKFVDPFVHISSNVISQAVLQRTPAGIFSPRIRADLLGKNGGVAQDIALGRALAGSALAVAVGSLAAEGLISGSGPSDPKEAATWRLTGWMPHAIRIGDSWVDIHRLGPLGLATGIAADLYEVAHMITHDDLVTVAHGLWHAFTQNILDESFMRGPADLIRAVTDPDRYGKRYFQQMFASFTPYSVGSAQVARAIDPYSRQTRSLMDEIKNKIPWLSETLLPRRDIWGEPIPNRDVVGVAGLSAIYQTKINHDPVNRALIAAGVFPAQPERKIRGVELSDQQYDDFSRVAGRMAKQRLNAIVGQPGFDALPQDVRAELIRSTIRVSREAARSLVMMQFPSIIKEAVGNKVQGIRPSAAPHPSLTPP